MATNLGVYYPLGFNVSGTVCFVDNLFGSTAKNYVHKQFFINFLELIAAVVRIVVVVAAAVFNGQIYIATIRYFVVYFYINESFCWK